MAGSKDGVVSKSAQKHNDRGEKAFATIGTLISATGGLSLSQICAVTGLEGTTIQNWVKRGWVSHPKNKRYDEEHVARILIIDALKECFRLEQISLLLAYVRGSKKSAAGATVKESDILKSLYLALSEIGNVDSMSKGGVEAVAENVSNKLEYLTSVEKFRVQRALTVMIFACVCTDVKRRTENMMEKILSESIASDPPKATLPDTEEHLPQTQDQQVERIADSIVSRRTVSQALRDWDRRAAGSTGVQEELTKSSLDNEISQLVDAYLSEDMPAVQGESVPENVQNKPIYFKRT